MQGQVHLVRLELLARGLVGTHGAVSCVLPQTAQVLEYTAFSNDSCTEQTGQQRAGYL